MCWEAFKTGMTGKVNEMKHNLRKTRSDLRDLAAMYRRFAKEEDGMVTIFACFMIFCMVMIGGVAVDMMRHEMERTRMQAVADRAVLAAADLDQTLDPEAVVHDYFAKSGMADFVSDVTVQQGINFRTVTVDASTTIKTQFMDFLGVETLIVPAISTAEEKVNKVEISMVLDISGSMRWNNKMPNLRNAAGVFLDSVLKPENHDLISVSLAPYTAQVNAGAEIFGLMDVNEVHPWSHCIDFTDDDFANTAIYAGNTANSEPYAHMQHFEASYSYPWSVQRNYNLDEISNPGCPKRDFEEVFPFSQDKAVLKARINQFQPRANTSIHLGMKWGVAMLDPAWRDFNAVLSEVDPAFRTRPADYPDLSNPSSSETLKTIILMTDGENVTTRRIKANKYNRKGKREKFSDYPLYGWLNRHVNSNRHYRYYETKYTPSQADALLEDICDAAKAKKVIIWSIAFEVSTHGGNVMRNCASSQSHFFAVEGTEITTAFASIARQINQLRLTQ